MRSRNVPPTRMSAANETTSHPSGAHWRASGGALKAFQTSARPPWSRWVTLRRWVPLGMARPPLVLTPGRLRLVTGAAHGGHGGRPALADLLGAEVLHVGRHRPLVTERIEQLAEPVTPEHVGRRHDGL